MKINSVAFFTHYTHTSAIEVYRVFSPLKEAGFNIISGIKDGQVNFEAIDQAELILCQRDFGQDLTRYEKLVKYARTQRKPIVFDIDDLLIEIPEIHPDRLNLTFNHAVLPMIRSISEADLVTVSTKKLKETLTSFNPNIVVLPNYLDTSIWQLREPRLNNIEDSPITIGYMGGGSHTSDLEYIQPVISDLLTRYENKIKFVVWGLQPPKELLRFAQTKWIRISTYSYEDFVNFFQRQQADIFIAPLVDNLFNRCKSEIKFLEYSALGSPTLASNLEPYNSIIKNGQNGFLASNYEEWTEYLIQLIENHDLRYKIALSALETVKNDWLISNNSDRWKSSYQNIKSEGLNIETHVILKKPLFNSITQQIFDLDQYQKKEIRNLHEKLKDKDQTIRTKDHMIQDKDLVIQKLNFQLASRAVILGQKMQKFYNRLAPEGSSRDKAVSHTIRFFKKINKSVFKQDNLSNDVNLIKASPYFDEDWYLSTYQDVAKLKMDPAVHYLKYGGFEARDPGPNFNSAFYLTTYDDAKRANMNPLLHYIRFGEKEDRKTSSNQQVNQAPIRTQESRQIPQNSKKVEIKMEEKKNIAYYSKRSLKILRDDGLGGLLSRGKQKVMKQITYESPLDSNYDPNMFDASVIIPVYNASDFTKSCIEKLYASPNLAKFEVIVVDNGSKDETKKILAEEQKRRENFSYYRMAENYGFSGGVNYGFSKAKGKHFIILNNDTLVTSGWIDRLIEAFNYDELIGIVSPVTNYVGEGNQVDRDAKDMTPTEIDAYAESIVDRGIIFESHRLVFFCVALKREVVDHLGIMDTGYVKGNFEDDDYCLRAILAGFKLAIAQNSFVYHFGSMTFKKNRIIHDDYMDKNRMRFYPKVQGLSLTLKPAKQLSNQVDISVVLRTLNRQALLKRALTSLSNQTYKDFEVVLVNDGGEDVSELVTFFSKYFSIKYVHNKTSQGRTPALNIGVAESNGSWVTFLDDDDIIYPWHLDMMHKNVESEIGHRLLYTNFNRSIFRTIKDDYAFLTQSIDPWFYDKNELLIRNRMPIHTWLVHRSAFNEVGWFDESMSMLEDFEFLIRLNKITDFYHINRVSCEYRYYLDGINSMINQRSKTLEALESIYAKHPVKDLDIEENRMLELGALKRQINTIEEIEKELSQDPQHAEVYQRKMLSQILGI